MVCVPIIHISYVSHSSNILQLFSRDKDQTLEEQFEQYTFTKEDDADSSVYISLDDVRNALNDNGKLKWIDDLFRQLLGTSSSLDMEFKDFIDFLETGKSPSTVAPKGDHAPSSPFKTSKKKKALQAAVAANASNNAPLSVFPGKPTIQRPQEVPIINLSTSSSAPSLSALLERNKLEEQERRKKQQLPHPPNQSPSSSSPSTSSTKKLGRNVGVYPEVAETLEYMLASTDKYAVVVKENGSSVAPPKPLWRKREVVRQEKAVYYTTVDGDGVTQELMEKETTQTEILHMECKETGEFAHRETTNHELLEKFNDEIVTHDTGKEEYVHLKSVDDEIEYMDSNMPRASGNAGEEGEGYDYANASKQQEEAMGADAANTNASNNECDKEGFPLHNNNHDDDNGSCYYAEGEKQDKAKTVEKLDVDEADVEEEMKRQWDMLSDEEKAYYEQAILEMEREKEAETLAQQECGNDTGGGSPASLSSVAPRGDIDIENEEGFAVCELSSPPNDCKEGDLPEVEASGAEGQDFADID